MTYLYVAAGSALGGVARFWLSGIITLWLGTAFPWATLVINVTGSAAIGFFSTLTAHDGRLWVPADIRQFFMVGVCGGYTTFSSFSLQTLSLIQQGEWMWAAANMVLSVLLCLLGVWLGHQGAVWLNP